MAKLLMRVTCAIYILFSYELHLCRAYSCDAAVFCYEKGTTKLFCYTCIPSVLPRYIEDVTITNNSIPIDNTSFSDTSWRSIRRLDITGSATTHLVANMFVNLQNLSYLGLHLSKLGTVPDEDSAAFWGLYNLHTLDLSNCVRFSFETVFKTFQNRANFPDLRILKLFRYNSCKYGSILDLNSTFLDTLTFRSVTTIELGDTLVNTFYMNPLHPFCYCLRRFTWKSPVVQHVMTFKNRGICKSLKQVHLSYINPTLSKQNIPDERGIGYELNRSRTMFVLNNSTKEIAKEKNIPTLTFDLTHNDRFNRYAHYFANVEELTISDSSGGIQIPEYLRIIFVYNSTLIWKARSFSLRRNNVTYLDVEFRTNLLQNLNLLDLSDNNLRFIGALFFKTLQSLKSLNLANNKLHEMEANEAFVGLISELEDLEYLDFSNNGLTVIPKSFFKTNGKLKVILLSRNSLTEFDHTELRSLVFLSLQSNKFTQLGEGSRSCMDKLHRYNKNFTVDFHDNPLQCSCDTLPFLTWSINSSFVLINNTQCSVNGAKKYLNKTTVASFESKCDNHTLLKRTILISSLVSVGVVVISITSAIVLRELRLIRRRRSRRTRSVKQLKENTFEYRSVLFLSYSSQNDDLVLNYIYPALSESFTNIACTANAEWQPVCIGDRHFRPGFSIYNEAHRCLKESAVVMAAVSREFCLSVHCRNELEQAMYMDKPIILLFLEEVATNEMNTIVEHMFHRNVRAKVEMKDSVLQFTPNVKNLCLSVLELVD